MHLIAVLLNKTYVNLFNLQIYVRSILIVFIFFYCIDFAKINSQLSSVELTTIKILLIKILNIVLVNIIELICQLYLYHISKHRCHFLVCLGNILKISWRQSLLAESVCQQTICLSLAV